MRVTEQDGQENVQAPPVVVAPPVVAGPLGTANRGAAWPKVVGIFSIVLGSLGIMKNGCGGISNIAQGAGLFGVGPRMGMTGFGAWSMAAGVVSLVSLAVSVLLLAAGIQLLKHRDAGVRLHKVWAWVRIAMSLIEAGIQVGVQIEMMSMFSQAAAGTGGAGGPGGGGGGAPPAGMMTMMQGFAFIGAAISLMISLAYPIVVLSVLSRPWAKQEIERWASLCGCGYDTRGLPAGAPCPECGKERTRCRSCGYDLQGLPPEAPCPECRAPRG